MSYLLLLPSNKLGKYTKIYLKKKTKKEENIKFTDDKNFKYVKNQNKYLKHFV